MLMLFRVKWAQYCSLENKILMSYFFLSNFCSESNVLVSVRLEKHQNGSVMLRSDQIVRFGIIESHGEKCALTNFIKTIVQPAS